MKFIFRGVAALSIAMFASSAGARSYTVTAATLYSTWNIVQPGDTLRLVGTFGLTKLQYKSFATAVTLDARSAVFTDTLTIRNVDRLNILGGKYGSATAKTTYGRAIIVTGGSAISISKPVVIGNADGQGINFNATTNASVTNGSFTSLWGAIAFNGVTGGWAKGNTITKSVSDGIDIYDSHNVTASYTKCSGGTPWADAHPDCIQLWSIAGHAVQSDITLTRNTAIGPTQGFTSFNPANGGGLRITMTYNTVNTSFPQGLACYGCVDSNISYNKVTTLAGSAHVTRISVIGGSNNKVVGNSVGPLPPVAKSAGLATALAFAETSSDAGGIGAVPEPAAWLMLIAGFGLVGATARRRRSLVTA